MIDASLPQRSDEVVAESFCSALRARLKLALEALP